MGHHNQRGLGAGAGPQAHPLAISLALPRTRPGAAYTSLLGILPFSSLSRRPRPGLPIPARGEARLPATPWIAANLPVWMVQGGSAPDQPLPAERRTLDRPSAPIPQWRDAPIIHLELLATLSPILRVAAQQQAQGIRGTRRRQQPLPVTPRLIAPLPPTVLTSIHLIQQARPGPSAQPPLAARTVWPLMPATHATAAARLDAPGAEPLPMPRQPASPLDAEHAPAQPETFEESLLVFREEGAPWQAARPVQPTSPPVRPVPGHADPAQPLPLVWRDAPLPALPDPPRFERERLPTPAVQGAADSLQAPGPYSVPALSHLVAVQDRLIQSVKREMTVEVERQRREFDRLLAQQARMHPAHRTAPGGMEIVSDAVVQALWHKLRTLWQEERFRQGYIR